MWWKTLLRLWRGALGSSRLTSASRRPRLRLTLEALEDRTVPSSYTAATVPELIATIDAANLTPEADTIALVAGRTFTLTKVNNTTNGSTGLPTIAANEDLTIVGNGDIIERSTATGTPAFRLFGVAAGASLRQENLTLQGGLAFGSGVSANGGAIYNEGTLDLVGVTVRNNTAEGARGGRNRPGASAAGAGIFSSGALTVQGGTIQNNHALGGRGGDGFNPREGRAPGRKGGDAFGGGLYIGGGTVLLTGVTLSANTAQGGNGGDGQKLSGNEGGSGGNGGDGLGGGLYAAAGSIEMHSVTVKTNTAQGGAGGKRGGSGSLRKDGSPGRGVGGGLYIDTAALACLDAFTVDHVKRNNASTSDPNIHGSYTICP